MIKKTSTKQNDNKEKKIKNDTKTKKKQIIKKTKSKLNSKNSSNKSKTKSKKTTELNSVKSKKNIVVKRSSGRKEKFDTDRLAQTVSRSGVSFPLARDVAKSVTKKIKKPVQNKSTGRTKKQQQQQQQQQKQIQKQKLKTNAKKEQKTVTVTASQIKNLVNNELKERNQQDHSPSSFSDSTIVGKDSSMKITLNDREPVIDNVAANKNKILYDPSKQK
ncbi:MAG TPA: hypothetical protein VJ583_00540 [Nitrososphaeraceae archaeon]|nr:hypothetical protein [Nitrososphaeraceae archaeon]